MPTSLPQFLVIRSGPPGSRVYLENMEETLENGSEDSGAEICRTTALNDRTDDWLTLGEIEKISV
jgi:hypothetical protein